MNCLSAEGTWAPDFDDIETVIGVGYRFRGASPLPDGRVLSVTKASHRGVRRLLALRREMGRVALYQAFAALAVGLMLGRWLVRPLKRLAQGAADRLLKTTEALLELARLEAALRRARFSSTVMGRAR